MGDCIMTQRILLLSSGLIMMVMMGTVYSWSVFRPFIEDHHGLNVEESGFPYMVSLVFYALSMMVTGRYMNQHNSRKVAVIGAVLIGVGWLLASQVHGLVGLVLSYGVLVGTGVGMLYGVPIFLIQRLCNARSGLYTGIVLAGFGMSPLLGAPLIDRMLRAYSVPMVFLTIGIVFLIGLTLCALVLPKALGDVARFEARTEKIDWTRFITMYVLFVVAAAIGLNAIGLSYKVGVDYYGYGGVLMAWMVAGFAFCNGVARPLFGWLMDRVSFATGATMSFSLIGLAAFLALINQGRSPILFALSFGLMWFNLGAWLAMIPVTVKKTFGLESYTRTYGLMFTAYGFGAVVGVWFSGFTLNTSGGMRPVYTMVLVTTMLALATLIAFIRRRWKTS